LAKCRTRGEGAFAPFFVLGDPSVELTLRWVDAVAATGPDLFEFGFPFSDPPADGPVIQAADQRALQAGNTPARCFEILAEARVRHGIPASVLVYANTVLQFGIDAFYARCAATGVDGVLVADLPIEESAPFVEAARGAGVAPVFVASRLSDEARLAWIAELGEAYVYLVGRVGVTGERRELDAALAGLVGRVRSATAMPVLVGFGISTPEQVRGVIAAGADGAVCGSAFVRRIAELGTRPEDCAAELRSFAATMKEATRVQLPM
jgi:tryptophan synthase alpha chain